VKKNQRKKIPSAVIDGLAKDLGKSLRTVRDYIRCGLPVSAKGYDRAEVQKWLDRRRGVAQESPEEERRWIVQFRKYKSERQKLQFMREAGKLIERAEAMEYLKLMADRIGHEILSLPDRLASATYTNTGNRETAVEVHQVAERIVREILFRLRRADDDISEMGMEGISDAEEKNSQASDGTNRSIPLARGAESQEDKKAPEAEGEKIDSNLGQKIGQGEADHAQREGMAQDKEPPG
jgi:hypothetical protein